MNRIHLVCINRRQHKLEAKLFIPFFYLLLVEITGAGSRGYIFAWLTVIVVVPSSRVYVSTLFRHLSVTFPLLYLLSCLSLLFLTSYIFLTPLLTILYLTPYFLYSNSHQKKRFLLLAQKFQILGVNMSLTFYF